MSKAKIKYRIIGGQGYWFAWSWDAYDIYLPFGIPHTQTCDVRVKGGWILVDGFTGKTPGEALYRLQSYLRKHYGMR